MTFCSIQEAIDDVKSGKFIIIVDDDGQGYLMMASERITPYALNFMTRHACGLLYVSMSPEMLDRLEIPMMVPCDRNRSKFATEFTVSVDACQGVSTGASTFDRTRTIHVLIDSETHPYDLTFPGHIFPLRSKSGGVLFQRGKTEASVDLSRLAGLKPSGVLCEIISEDGTMARLSELIRFQKKYGINIISVNMLVRYLEKQKPLWKHISAPGIIRKGETIIPTEYGTFKAVSYQDFENNKEHLALSIGCFENTPPLVRVHSACLTGDVFGSNRCDCGAQLKLVSCHI